GLTELSRHAYDEAETTFKECERLWRSATGESLNLAAAMVARYEVLNARDDDVDAEALLKQVLDIQERLAPDSLLVAGTLCRLGVHAHYRGDFKGSTKLSER